MRFFRIFRIALVATAVAAGGIAQAHPRLVGSTPSANSAVAAVNRIQLRFSERLISGLTGADVVMTGMPGVAQAKPHKFGGFAATVGADGRTLTLASGRPLPAGTYEVRWHAVAADTHRVQGRFPFAVGAPHRK